MRFDLLKPRIQPFRFIAAFGSEEMRNHLEPMLASIREENWDYVVTMGTEATLKLSPKDRRRFILAEYGHPSLDLDLVRVVKHFQLPLLLVSNGHEPIARATLDSSATYGYLVNPTPEELLMELRQGYAMAVAGAEIKKAQEYIEGVHGYGGDRFTY